NWIAKSDRFWYRVATSRGSEFVYVEPARRLRRPAFDHVRLAAALGRAADTTLSPDSLPFQTLKWEEQGATTAIVVEARKKTWRCDLAAYRCDSTAAPKKPAADALPSPDGKWIAFLRDHNLYLRSTEHGKDLALPSDGALHYD